MRRAPDRFSVPVAYEDTLYVPGNKSVAGWLGCDEYFVCGEYATVGQYLTVGENLTVGGVIVAGSGTHQLTNAAGLLDGAKLQAGTVDTDQLANDAVNAAKLDETGSYAMVDLDVTGDLGADGAVTAGSDINCGDRLRWFTNDGYAIGYASTPNYGPVTGNAFRFWWAAYPTAPRGWVYMASSTPVFAIGEAGDWKCAGDGDLVGDLDLGGDLDVAGGDISAGEDGAEQGTLTLWDGSGGNKPAYIKMHSPNGTAHYLFFEDDGTLKQHTSAPTQNSDGSVVGAQT